MEPAEPPAAAPNAAFLAMLPADVRAYVAGLPPRRFVHLTNHVRTHDLHVPLDVHQAFWALMDHGVSASLNNNKNVLVNYSGVTIMLCHNSISCTGSRSDLDSVRARCWLMCYLAHEGLLYRGSAWDLRAGALADYCPPAAARRLFGLPPHCAPAPPAPPLAMHSLLWAARNVGRAAAYGMDRAAFAHAFTRERHSNCVCSANLDVPLHLPYVAYIYGASATLEARFPAVHLKLASAGVSMLLARSGRVLLMGGRSMEQTQRALDDNLPVLYAASRRCYDMMWRHSTESGNMEVVREVERLERGWRYSAATADGGDDTAVLASALVDALGGPADGVEIAWAGDDSPAGDGGV